MVKPRLTVFRSEALDDRSPRSTGVVSATMALPVLGLPHPDHFPCNVAPIDVALGHNSVVAPVGRLAVTGRPVTDNPTRDRFSRHQRHHGVARSLPGCRIHLGGIYPANPDPLAGHGNGIAICNPLHFSRNGSRIGRYWSNHRRRRRIKGLDGERWRRPGECRGCVTEQLRALLHDKKSERSCHCDGGQPRHAELTSTDIAVGISSASEAVAVHEVSKLPADTLSTAGKHRLWRLGKFGYNLG